VFSQNGLSLDQAPPISVVLRFFLVGSIFGILAGIWALMFGDDVFQDGSAIRTVFVHLLTLGVMLFFMLAALFQMLPVVAGIKLSTPTVTSTLLLYPIVLGIFALFAGLLTMQRPWILMAMLLLGGGVIAIAIIILPKLLRLPHHTGTSRGMIFSLLSLLFLVTAALYMLGSIAGFFEGNLYASVKKIHHSFALFGWITLLIISVSFQVIEMFYVTPPLSQMDQ
jgi:hypothetical protein